MIKLETVTNELIIVFFPNEFIHGNYKEHEITLLKDATIVYHINEIKPNFKWKIIKHFNLNRVADYDILGSNKKSIEFFLDDLFKDLIDHNINFLYDKIASINITKLIYEITKYHNIDIDNDDSMILSYVDLETLERLKSKERLNFNYFFPND
jgi:hypothetical protein